MRASSVSESGEGVSGFSTIGSGVVGQNDAECGVRGLVLNSPAALRDAAYHYIADNILPGIG